MQHRNTYIPRFRISLVRETRGIYTEQKLSSSADADRLLRPMLQNLDREHFVVIGLDAKNAVIGMNTVSIGSLTLAIVHPREVCKPLILMNAAGFICAHNLCGATHKLCYVALRVMWSSCTLTRLRLPETCECTVSSCT